MTFNEKMKQELNQVRALTDEALERTGGDLEAGMRAGMDYALKALPTDLKFLRAHGLSVDGGSYFLGNQIGGMVFAGIDPVAALHHPVVRRLLGEYADKARQL